MLIALFLLTIRPYLILLVILIFIFIPMLMIFINKKFFALNILNFQIEDLQNQIILFVLIFLFLLLNFRLSFEV